MSHSEQGLSILYRARDSANAALLKTMLDASGVPTRLAGGKAAVGFGELGAGALLVDLMVPTEQLAEGRRLLEAFWRDRADAAEAPPWKCPSCAEANEPSFEICWKCEAKRPGN